MSAKFPKVKNIRQKIANCDRQELRKPMDDQSLPGPLVDIAITR